MGLHAQRKIEGNVKDSQTGKNIAFANVTLQREFNKQVQIYLISS